SSLDAGRGMVDCLNAVGVTHVTFGNHEDDLTTDELRARAKELHAKWLATNVRAFDPALPVSDVVVVRAPGGRALRGRLVGVVMDDRGIYRRQPFGGGTIEPPNAAARRETARLLAEGCACVVPLTHQTMEADRALAREEQDPRFSVIVGGHEHEIHVEQIAGTWIVKAGS